MNEDNPHGGNQTPKFLNRNVSFDLSHINNNGLINNNSDLDLISLKSDFAYLESVTNQLQNLNNTVNKNNNSNLNISNINNNFNNQVTNSKPPDLNYIFDFKDDCDITISKENINFNPSLAFYRTTFENYLLDTELFLKNKYKNDKNKITNIPYKVHKLRVKMILKIINEVFLDDRDIFHRHKFARDFNDNIVKKKICYVLKFNIPQDEIEKIEEIIKNKGKLSNNLDGIDDNLLHNKSLLGGFNPLEKLKPILFSHSCKSYSREEFKELLELTFIEVNYNNPKLYRVFREVLASLKKLNFILFLKCFCIFLQFSEGLLSKIKIIGKEAHIEMFCDDNIYQKKCEALGYNFEMSQYGKTKLIDINRPISQNADSDIFTIYEYTKYLHIPYVSHSVNLLELYDTLKDDKIKDSLNVLYEPTKMSFLRNVDRIRLLKWSIDNCVNLKNLKLYDIFEGISIKRDITIYEKKHNNYVYSNLNILDENEIFKTLKRFRNTYGEMISFYFLWTYHILKWTIYLCFCLIIFLVAVQFEFSRNFNFFGISIKNILNYLFCLMIIIWFFFFIQSWKAIERVYTIKWGISENGNLRIQEKDRHDYDNNETVELFSAKLPRQNYLKNFFSLFTSIFITIVMIILTSTCLIFFQEIQMPPKIKQSNLDLLFSAINKKVTSNEQYYKMFPYFIGFYIKLLEIVYDYICEKITDGENHQKDSSYNKSYTIKNLLFKMINKYFTLYYIIFVKTHYESCPAKSCGEYLGTQLRKIFISYYIISLIEISLKYLANLLIRFQLKSTIVNNNPEANQSQIKNLKRLLIKKYSYVLYEQYDKSNIQKDYIHLMIMFGFIAQFSIIDPLILILFAFYIYLKRFIDASKISLFHNVDIFEPENSIKYAKNVLKFILLLSSITNLYIIVFIMGIDEKMLAKVDRWYFYSIAQIVLIILGSMVNLEMLPNWIKLRKQIQESFILARNSYVKSRPTPNNGSNTFNKLNNHDITLNVKDNTSMKSLDIK